MINRSRDIVRMGATWYAPGTEKSGYLEGGAPDIVIDEEERARKLDKLSKSVWSFSRALARHLTPPEEDEEAFQKDVRERIDPEQAEALIAAEHRPNRAMFDIGCAINGLPMHFMRRNQMDADIALFEDISGGCGRIFSSSIPLVYSRHSARFLGLYLSVLSAFGPVGTVQGHMESCRDDPLCRRYRSFPYGYLGACHFFGGAFLHPAPSAIRLESIVMRLPSGNRIQLAPTRPELRTFTIIPYQTILLNINFLTYYLLFCQSLLAFYHLRDSIDA